MRDALIVAAWIVGPLLGCAALMAAGARVRAAWLMRTHGDAYHAFIAAATPVVVEAHPTDPQLEYVIRIVDEVEGPNGQLAVCVAVPERATAVHQINQNGTFAKKGPYLIAWRSLKWKQTGRRHLARLLRGRNGQIGFRSSHPNQRTATAEHGIAIIEYATTKYHPVDIATFVDEVLMRSHRAR